MCSNGLSSRAGLRMACRGMSRVVRYHQKKLSKIIDAEFTQMRDCRVSALGVVLKAETSKGDFFKSTFGVVC